MRIQQAIDHILEMQRYDGGFALWSSAGQVEQWLSAYAMDFLTRAKAKGYDVSDINYQNGLRWLADFAQRRDENDTDTLSARAYALYVLATVGDENLSALRYVADNQIDKLPTALAQAQIGAALALHGDQTRAADAFKKAQATLKRETGRFRLVRRLWRGAARFRGHGHARRRDQGAGHRSRRICWPGSRACRPASNGFRPRRRAGWSWPPRP